MPDSPAVISPNLISSLIRTVAPFLGAFIVAYLAKNGVAIDNQTVNGEVVLALGSVWYGVVRAVEQKWPSAGWLLGSPKQPSYDGEKS